MFYSLTFFCKSKATEKHLCSIKEINGMPLFILQENDIKYVNSKYVWETNFNHY